FVLRILLQGCDLVNSSCVLNGIVVPALAKPHMVAPLADVWPQLRAVNCRLRDETQVGKERRWKATGCELVIGSEYAVVLQLESVGGGDIVHLVDLKVALPPTQIPRSLELVDSNPKPGYLFGKVYITGALDETDILQYILYWGRGNGSKVNFLKDENQAVIGWVNTYGGGGLRNGFENECLFNDCRWKMQLAVSADKDKGRRAEFIIRQADTNDCLCYRSKVLVAEACDDGLLQVDGAQAFYYPVAGEGCLIDDQNQLYKTVWYRDIGPKDVFVKGSPEQIAQMATAISVLEEVCSTTPTCKGYALNLGEKPDGLLFYDASYNTSEAPGLWPPDRHPALVAVNAEMALSKYGKSTATGPPKKTMTSIDVGALIEKNFAWYGWRSYRRVTKGPDCLWYVTDKILNGTVESRLVQALYNECLCQVPQSTMMFGEDGIAQPGFTAGVDLRIGKFCDSTTFSFSIAGLETPTQGLAALTALSASAFAFLFGSWAFAAASSRRSVAVAPVLGLLVGAGTASAKVVDVAAATGTVRLQKVIAENGLEDWTVGDYEAMRDDEPRTQGYEAAIRKRLAGTGGNATVVDIGTGAFALLAIMAAKAGARKVYAIEKNLPAAKQAREVIAKAGLQDQIEVIEGDSMLVELPERVDLIVSELIGSIATQEGVEPIIKDATKRFLKEESIVSPRMIPSRSQTRIVPIRYRNHRALKFQRGVLSRGKPEPDTMRPLRLRGKTNDLIFLSEPQLLEDFDFSNPERTAKKEIVSLKFDVPAKLVEDAMDFSGFAMWTRLVIDDENSVEVKGQKVTSHWAYVVALMADKPMPIPAPGILTLDACIDYGSSPVRYTFETDVPAVAAA
ncbi:unnamed protein product, partial [Polarella glacialis]